MKSELIQIRVEKKVKMKLKKLADADKRSLGSFILLQLEKLYNLETAPH